MKILASISSKCPLRFTKSNREPPCRCSIIKIQSLLRSIFWIKCTIFRWLSCFKTCDSRKRSSISSAFILSLLTILIATYTLVSLCCPSITIPCPPYPIWSRIEYSCKMMFWSSSWPLSVAHNFECLGWKRKSSWNISMPLALKSLSSLGLIRQARRICLEISLMVEYSLIITSKGA